MSKKITMQSLLDIPEVEAGVKSELEKYLKDLQKKHKGAIKFYGKILKGKNKLEDYKYIDSLRDNCSYPNCINGEKDCRIFKYVNSNSYPYIIVKESSIESRLKHLKNTEHFLSNIDVQDIIDTAKRNMHLINAPVYTLFSMDQQELSELCHTLSLTPCDMSSQINLKIVGRVRNYNSFDKVPTHRLRWYESTKSSPKNGGYVWRYGNCPYVNNTNKRIGRPLSDFIVKVANHVASQAAKASLPNTKTSVMLKRLSSGVVEYYLTFNSDIPVVGKIYADIEYDITDQAQPYRLTWSLEERRYSWRNGDFVTQGETISECIKKYINESSIHIQESLFEYFDTLWAK